MHRFLRLLRAAMGKQLCCAVMLCFLVGHSSAAPEHQVVLKIFGYRAGVTQVEVLEECINEFRREYPNIAVMYEPLSNREGYLRMLERRMKTGHLDDMFMLNAYAFSYMAEQGLMEEHILDMTASPLLKRLRLELMPFLSTEKGMPGIPLEISAFGMFVNTDALREHGLTLPRSRGEFFHACEALKSSFAEPLGGTLIPLGYSPAYTILAVSLWEARNSKNRPNQGGWTTNVVDAARLLRPGVEFVSELTEAGYWSGTLMAQNRAWQSDLVHFANREHVFVAAGSWCFPLLRLLGGDFNVEFTPLPFGETEGMTLIAPDTTLCVNKNSPHVKEALLFLDFITRRQYLDRFATVRNTLSPLKDSGGPNEALRFVERSIREGKTAPMALPYSRVPLREMAGKAGEALLRGAATEDVMTMLKTFDLSQALPVSAYLESSGDVSVETLPGEGMKPARESLR